MSASWRLHLVGLAQLRSTAEPGHVLNLSRKDAAWLARVAMGPVAHSLQVANLVWPAAGERAALNSLRQRVYRLRQSTGARLVEMAETLTLAADLSLQDPAGVEALASNPEAWDAELLAGLHFDAEPDLAAWLAAARLARVQRRKDALGRIASEAERQGELVRAFGYAQRLLAEDPLSEHAHRRVIRLHYLRGDTAAAVAAFEACECVLKEELGLKPSAETLALLQTVESAGRDRAGGGMARAVPASLARPPRLVGRLSARQALTDAEQQAQVAVLVGEAGMGKTRLLQEHLQGRSDVLHFNARPGDAAVPFATLLRWLHLLDEPTAPWAAVAEPVADTASCARGLKVQPAGTGDAQAVPIEQLSVRQRQLAMEARLALAVRNGLALVAADDLHFADRASAELLLALIESRALAGLRWIVAHRPLEAAVAGSGEEPLLAAFAESTQARWVRLEPLAADDLHELVASLAVPGMEPATLAPALLRHTGGNPLFVVETLRAAALRGSGGTLALPKPQGLAHLIDQRLHRLSRPAMALARVAALATPDFSIELAEHVLGAPALVLADAWQELEAAQVLRGEAFAHDLVHDAVLRASPEAIARHAHRQIAVFLARRGAEPARIAEHWVGAGDCTQAAVAFRQAAGRARRSGRAREHAQLLLRAADCLDASDDAASALRARADALLALLEGHGLQRAEALCSRLVEAAGDGPLAALAWTRRATLMMHGGKASEAEAAARRALGLLGTEPLDLRVQATVALALALRGSGRGEDGLEMLQALAPRIDAVADPLVRIEFHSAQAIMLHSLDRLDDAVHALQRQMDEIRATGETGENAAIHLGLAAIQLRRGDAQAALRHAQDASAEQPDFDAGGTVPAYTRFLLGCALCAAGRYGEGLALLDEGRQMLAADSPGTVVHSNTEAAMAEVLLQIGQPAKALQLMATDHAGLTPAGRVRRWLVRAAVLRTLGQDNSGLLDKARSEIQAGAGAYWQQLVQIEQAHQSDPEAVIECCKAVLGWSRRNGDRAVSLLAATRRLQALCSLGGSRPGTHPDHAAFELLQQLQCCQTMLIYRPAVLLVCARAFTLAGQAQTADRCLADARDWIRQVALPNVPDPLRDGFLYRCPVNLAVQGEASHGP